VTPRRRRGRSRDFTGLIILGALWFLLNLMGKSREGGRPRPPRPAPPRRGPDDATQREGGKLEALFRELERQLNEASGQPQRPVGVPLPSAEDVEERTSLESEPVVVSLEDEVHRPLRAVVAQDDAAEAIVAARVKAAEARSGALSSADHAAFDARIRVEPADATAVRQRSIDELRRAVVWREILGPPVSERGPER
jgi:hypothetical protein